MDIATQILQGWVVRFMSTVLRPTAAVVLMMARRCGISTKIYIMQALGDVKRAGATILGMVAWCRRIIIMGVHNGLMLTIFRR